MCSKVCKLNVIIVALNYEIDMHARIDITDLIDPI